MMHLYAGMKYSMINQLEKDMFYMDVCCCSNYNASLNSVDEHKFFRAVIHLPRVKEHITLPFNITTK